MRTIVLLMLVLLATNNAYSQKKEKLKGSRIVTLQAKDVATFNNIEVSDNVEVFLIKGSQSGVEIEADDNLHDAITIDVTAGTLFISTAQDVTSSKKFSVRITYTPDLDLIVARNHVLVTAITDMEVGNLTIKTFDSARFFGTVKGNEVTIMANDKTRQELNLTAQKTTVELSKNATMKALISSSLLIFDMYQKSSAAIEGDIVDLKLRLDGNSEFLAKNLTSTNADITTEGYSACRITVSTKVMIDASGKSEIQLTGEPNIEIRKFADSAILAKKPVR